MELKIQLKYIKELLSRESNKSVSKIMKRFEIIKDSDVLKKEVKELIYESYRDLGDALIAGGRGLEKTYWNFTNKNKEKD